MTLSILPSSSFENLSILLLLAIIARWSGMPAFAITMTKGPIIFTTHKLLLDIADRLGIAVLVIHAPLSCLSQ